MKYKPLSNQDISHICRSLSLLLHAGLTLAEGVSLLAREESPQKGLYLQLGEGLDEGKTLSDSLSDAGCFPGAVHRMVRMGEESGRLEEALRGLADYYDRRHRSGKQLQNAICYPGMTLLLVLVVIGVLLVKVLPIFDEVYASLGSRLTGIAGGLLQLGQMLKAALPVLFALLCLMATAAVLFAGNGKFREWVLGKCRKKFGDKGIFRAFNNARFAQGLAMGLGSGMPLEEAVTLSAEVLQEIPGAAKRASLCAEKIAEGHSLSDALREGELLDAAACRMLSLGIRGGSGDAVMAEIAETQMERAEELLENAIAKIEPAMVLTASILVGLILLSVMLPLMHILSVLG